MARLELIDLSKRYGDRRSVTVSLIGLGGPTAKSNLVGPEFKTAQLGLLLGRPLLGEGLFLRPTLEFHAVQRHQHARAMQARFAMNQHRIDLGVVENLQVAGDGLGLLG